MRWFNVVASTCVITRQAIALCTTGAVRNADSHGTIYAYRLTLQQFEKYPKAREVLHMISENQPRRGGKQRSDESTRYARAEEAESRSRGSTRRENTEANALARHSANREGARLPHISADRPIFTLSVAADLLGLHPRTLRIYEEKQLVVPARTEGNRRRYSQNDINRFQSIRRLTSGGVNLEGVRIILDMADELARFGGDPEMIIERNLPPTEE